MITPHSKNSIRIKELEIDGTFAKMGNPVQSSNVLVDFKLRIRM